MRQVKLEDNSVIEVRGLTRREVKQFKTEGIEFSSMSPDAAEKALDDVLEIVVDKKIHEKLEDMTFRYSSDVFRAVLKETFGAPDEEKNSSAT
jgi:DNA-directed RNA polymerase subunit F